MASFFVGPLEPCLKASFICGSGSWIDNPAVTALRPTATTNDRRRVRSALQAALTALTALMLAGAALPVAWADGDRDHERARAAVRAGEVLPLPTLLKQLQRTHPGQVLELELERDDGRWLYEVKLLQADGLLLKLELDAGSGQVLQVKRRGGASQEGRR
jgi:uncharacterized membrane protein YkoI